MDKVIEAYNFPVNGILNPLNIRTSESPFALPNSRDRIGRRKLPNQMSKNTDKPNRPSGADYPVAAAERSSQEARLKKAAAAGASASKSAIPGLILQPPASVPPSQKIPGPQTPLSDAAGSTETAPEVSDARSTQRVANDEILAELRKISAWADFRRKTTKWSLVFLALLVPVLIGVAILLDQHLKTNLESTV